MNDISNVRRKTMQAVKGKDTTPELLVRRLLFSLGYRYRLHCKDLPGKPDIVFPGRKKVIFVNGCFWHGHNCKRGVRKPKTNEDYWKNKLERNVERDRFNENKLRNSGWDVLTIWECELKNNDQLIAKLVTYLDKQIETRR